VVVITMMAYPLLIKRDEELLCHLCMVWR